MSTGKGHALSGPRSPMAAIKESGCSSTPSDPFLGGRQPRTTILALELGAGRDSSLVPEPRVIQGSDDESRRHDGLGNTTGAAYFSTA